jgi:hypothetical protein
VVKFPGLIAIIYTSQQKKRYNIFYIWFCLRIRPTTGRLARSPDSRNLLQTVYSNFGRLLDQIFYGQYPQPLSYGSGGEWEINVCLDVLTSHATCRYGVCHSSHLFVEDESLALKWLF